MQDRYQTRLFIFINLQRVAVVTTTPLKLLRNIELALTTRVQNGCRSGCQSLCQVGARQGGLAEPGKIVCNMHAMLECRYARPAAIGDCIDVRGMTRENAISALRPAELCITHESRRKQVQSGAQPGIVCVANGNLVGYRFADRQSGEIMVLALLADIEKKVWAAAFSNK